LYFIVILAGFSFICGDIGKEVKSIAEVACQKYPGDTVDALIAFVDSEEKSLRRRNRAIWALGQLGRKKALPVLEKHNHGGPYNRDRDLSQYEIKKAIAHCRGGLNITAWTWRWPVNEVK